MKYIVATVVAIFLIVSNLYSIQETNLDNAQNLYSSLSGHKSKVIENKEVKYLPSKMGILLKGFSVERDTLEKISKDLYKTLDRAKRLGDKKLITKTLTTIRIVDCTIARIDGMVLSELANEKEADEKLKDNLYDVLKKAEKKGNTKLVAKAQAVIAGVDSTIALIDKEMEKYLYPKPGPGAKIDTFIVKRAKIDTLVNEITIFDTVTIIKGVNESEELDAINRASMHLINALQYYYDEDFEKAIEECKEAIRIAPKLSLPYLRLGSIYYRLGDTKRALYYWKESQKINPNNEELNRILGNIKK